MLQGLYALDPAFHKQLNFRHSYSTYQNTCKCNLCSRQSPTLRDLASHSFFNHTFELSEFQLTARTLYHHYLYAANSPLVPEHKLLPYTGNYLQSAYAHNTLCRRETRFNEYCIPDCYVCWRSFDNEHCASYEEIIAKLCFNKNRRWCTFFDGHLFIPTQCLLDDEEQ